jgi:hypothetical protein
MCARRRNFFAPPENVSNSESRVLLSCVREIKTIKLAVKGATGDASNSLRKK